MRFESPYSKAKRLVAGQVSWEDLCRYAAHNLAERREVENAIEEALNSFPPKDKGLVDYLYLSLSRLEAEKKVLLEKAERIKYYTTNFNFII